MTTAPSAAPTADSAADLVDSLLGPEGRLGQFLPGFVYRAQQVEVARAISSAFEEEEICLAEAGTGVGKTMAYLVPALEQIKRKKRVIVSTHTLNLQGQLIAKDIPLLQRAVPEIPFEAVLVKGMSNYLCQFNLDYEGSQIQFDGDPLFKKLRSWTGKTQTGDVAELNFRLPGWGDLCCDRDTCHRQECRFYDRCFYFGMRRAAEAADILVANHALFFSDLVIRMAEPKAGILPPYDIVIFDEAHHLEEVASRTFGVEFSNYRVPSFLSRLRRLRSVELSLSRLDAIESLNSELFNLLESARRQEFFLSDILDPSGMSELNGRSNDLQLLLKEVADDLLGRAKELGEGDESTRERLEGYARTATRLRVDLELLAAEDDRNWFVWGERPSQPGRAVRTVLHRTPVKVSELLSEKFWGRVKGAALVSATLSNSGGFSFLRSRLGIEEAHEVIVGSPFDFFHQCLLYVPVHFPFPSDDPAYVEAMIDEMEFILNASQGRAFLLFTSYRMLDRVHRELISRLDYPVLRQGEMPNQALLEEFRRLPHACLCGTSSFWEGVDVQGEQLSCVIIDKLPFSVPDTPTARARMHAVEEAGGNSFADLSVPEAQLRLKQGFGRLIRTQTDHGVVAIFDSRIVKKGYGKAFLDTLPRARRTRTLDDIRRFFERTRSTAPDDPPPLVVVSSREERGRDDPG